MTPIDRSPSSVFPIHSQFEWLTPNRFPMLTAEKLTVQGLSLSLLTRLISRNKLMQGPRAKSFSLPSIRDHFLSMQSVFREYKVPTHQPDLVPKAKCGPELRQNAFRPVPFFDQKIKIAAGLPFTKLGHKPWVKTDNQLSKSSSSTSKFEPKPFKERVTVTDQTMELSRLRPGVGDYSLESTSQVKKRMQHIADRQTYADGIMAATFAPGPGCYNPHPVQSKSFRKVYVPGKASKKQQPQAEAQNPEGDNKNNEPAPVPVKKPSPPKPKKESVLNPVIPGTFQYLKQRLRQKEALSYKKGRSGGRKFILDVKRSKSPGPATYNLRPKLLSPRFKSCRLDFDTRLSKYIPVSQRLL